MSLRDFRIVLVSPLFAGNVGAVARVCANFGIGDVAVVNAQCDWRGAEALRYAKGPAKDVLAGMRAETGLASGLRGCSASVGFTRRTGEGRSPSIELPEIAALGSRSGRVALVFGREDSGLTRGELESCTHLCTFATSDVMPSLNLSHAVAVVASRLFEDCGSGASKVSAEPVATLDELGGLYAHWEELLGSLELGAGNAERLVAKIRPALARSELTASEVAAFRAVLSKTQVALGVRVNQRRRPRE